MSPARVRLLWLLLLTAVPAAVEAAALNGVGFRTALPLAPQVSAVWPYGSLHDLRWVLVYHDSWATFTGELLAAIGTRGLLCAALAVLAWPPELPRPSVRRLIGRNLVFAAVTIVVLAPWAGLAVIASEVSMPWFVVLELLPLLALIPFLQRGGIVPGWWRGLPPLSLAGWSILGFVVSSLGGALVWSVPGWWAVPAAAVAGAGNGLLWRAIVRAAVTTGRVRWRWVPVAPLAVAVVASLVAAVDLSGVGPRTVFRQPLDVLAAHGDAGHAVIFLAGYDSYYTGVATSARPIVVRFSYRGTDPHGFPMPYSPADTHQSLITSAGLLATQVDRLHALTGRPVALVGESEGSLILRYYLDRWRPPAVDTAVLTSPPIRAGRVYYPPPDADEGWGIATGWLLRGVFAAKRGTASVPDGADEPFLRSLIDNAPFFRNQLLCPEPGVRMIAYLPSSDSITVPPALFAQIPLVDVSGLHGTLIKNPGVVRDMIEFITGQETAIDERIVPVTRWDSSILQGAVGAWQAPALATSINPVWTRSDDSDVSFRGRSCPP